MRDPNQGLRGSGRRAPTLLPILQRAHRHAYKFRELRLRQAGLDACLDHRRNLDLCDASNAPALVVLEALDGLRPRIAAFLKQKMTGITRTKDIVMRSRRIPGPQAHQWGVATDCLPDALLESATDALVDELRSVSPLAQRTAKKLLNDTEDSPLSIAIELEGHCYSPLRSSEDFKEGVEAFHSKRRARFVGR